MTTSFIIDSIILQATQLEGSLLSPFLKIFGTLVVLQIFGNVIVSSEA